MPDHGHDLLFGTFLPPAVGAGALWDAIVAMGGPGRTAGESPAAPAVRDLVAAERAG